MLLAASKPVSRGAIEYLKHPMLMGLLTDTLWRVRAIKDCYLVRTDSLLEADFDTENPITDNDGLVKISTMAFAFCSCVVP